MNICIHITLSDFVMFLIGGLLIKQAKNVNTHHFRDSSVIVGKSF